MDSTTHDVVIVGGRPAGSSLAARLAAAGLRVLIVERASFPSTPAVSAPFLLPHAIALIDEIGVDEAAYTVDTPQLRGFVLELAGYFRSVLDFEAPIAGRSYFYTIDRAQLDHALWQALARWPSVTAWTDARVEDLLRDEGGRVVGVVIERGGARVEARAGAVIGADGRFSTVARKVDARVTEERPDVATTVYYDFWEGVADYEPGGPPLAHIHSSCDGFSFVLMPTSRGRTIVLAQGRADSYEALDGAPDAAYESLLRARPRLWRRLKGAHRAGDLAGMKRVGNLFREPGGPGWALCGDAYHQKDSIDAQGIYDALLGAKELAAQVIRWHRGEATWEAAFAAYGAAIYAKCKPMFDSTMGRLAREIYSVPPPGVAKTVMRWMLTNPAYGRRYSALVTRQIDPAAFLTPPVALSFIAGGALQRLRRRIGGRDPSDALPT